MGISFKFTNMSKTWSDAVDSYINHKSTIDDCTRLVVSYLTPLNRYKFLKIRADIIDDILSAKVSGSSLNRYRNVVNAIIKT